MGHLLSHQRRGCRPPTARDAVGGFLLWPARHVTPLSVIAASPSSPRRRGSTRRRPIGCGRTSPCERRRPAPSSPRLSMASQHRADARFHNCPPEATTNEHSTGDQAAVQISPTRIHRLDETHLPDAAPLLERLLPTNGRSHVTVHLVVDESLHAVRRREAWDHSAPVLPDASDKVAGDPDVERSPPLACEYVNGRLFVEHPTREYALRCGDGAAFTSTPPDQPHRTTRNSSYNSRCCRRICARLLEERLRRHCEELRRILRAVVVERRSASPRRLAAQLLILGAEHPRPRLVA